MEIFFKKEDELNWVGRKRCFRFSFVFLLVREMDVDVVVGVKRGR